MEAYFIIIAICSLLRALRLGMLIRIIFFKHLFPKVTIKEIESFEEKIKGNYLWNKKV